MPSTAAKMLRHSASLSERSGARMLLPWIDAGADQSAQCPLALVQAERCALAGRAEHGEAVAAVGQRLQTVGDEAWQVDRTVFGERRGESDGKTETVGAQRH